MRADVREHVRTCAETPLCAAIGARSFPDELTLGGSSTLAVESKYVAREPTAPSERGKCAIAQYQPEEGKGPFGRIFMRANTYEHVRTFAEMSPRRRPFPLSPFRAVDRRAMFPRCFQAGRKPDFTSRAKMRGA